LNSFVLNTITIWFQTIIPEILKNLEAIATNEHGRKVILSLVAWRDSSYFHPRDIDLMKKGESLKDW